MAAENIDDVVDGLAGIVRLTARPGGLVRPALQLIRSTESDDVPAVITHLDNAMEGPSARQGTR
ncbi:hypothetical protein [Streptomyces yerevanensis]|uniref:hypothetical protein n=1 Tax=Streptomyces yerevanensis TaxID=66378 RepID=UPI0005257A59|nr:hypothetical protein [Streptomyces yerevanensis]